MKRVLLIGYGNVGQMVAKMLVRAGQRVLVVDRDFREVQEEGLEFLRGDALDEKLWKTIDLSEFEIAVVALPRDIDVTFCILILKNTNSSLPVIARANNMSSVEKIYRAGADYVAPLSSIAAQMTLRVILGGSEISEDIAPITEMVEIERYSIVRDSPLEGKKLRDTGIKEKTGAIVLGIKDGEGRVIQPDPDVKLEEGMVLAVFGTKEQIEKFKRIFGE